MEQEQKNPPAVKIEEAKQNIKDTIAIVERIGEMFVAGGFVAIVFSSAFGWVSFTIALMAFIGCLFLIFLQRRL